MLLKTFALAAGLATSITAAALPRHKHLHARAPLPTGTTDPATAQPSQGSTYGDNTPKAQQVVYWGQADAQRNLGAYCEQNAGIDIIIIAFLSHWGDSGFKGTFGTTCQSLDQTCTDVEQQVQQCKAAGKKIFVSMGGYHPEGNPGGAIASKEAGEQLAQKLFDSFGNPAKASNQGAPRPLGKQIVDGWDMDVEENDAAQNENYQYMLNKLRQLFEADTENKYALSAAPQCPIVEPYMGKMIQESKFDHLFIQFYNNPACSANNYRDGNKQGFNFDAWRTQVGTGASKNAKLYIGLPGSPLGATGKDTGAKYYLKPADAKGLIGEYKSHEQFGGVMLWDAANSDKVNEGGCNYAQNIRKILDTGNAC